MGGSCLGSRQCILPEHMVVIDVGWTGMILATLEMLSLTKRSSKSLAPSLWRPSRPM